mmetsp:Transcript_2866/g.4169  ORF Transcript_2866/g.4169 Transcript_2866/m.4169 type:complete len:1321 (+) Transcript_2866:405-4367(+)
MIGEQGHIEDGTPLLGGGREISWNKSLTIELKEFGFTSTMPGNNPNRPLQYKPIREANVRIKGAKLTGIIGARGGGRRELLNFLSGDRSRLGAFSWEGKLVINNKPIRDFSRLYSWSEYVDQEDDFVHNELTVREAISYTTLLEKPSKKVASKEKISVLMDDFELKKYSNSRVVDISKLHRRLLSIALRMISSPAILLLEEPERGLDLSCQSLLFKCLHSIATKQKRTVVCSVDQMSSESFHILDHVTIMHEGYSCYDGRSIFMTDFFCEFGFFAPRTYNPVTFVRNVCTGNAPLIKDDRRCDEAKLKELLERKSPRRDQFLSLFFSNKSKEEVQADVKMDSIEFNSFPDAKTKANMTFYFQRFKVLTRREFAVLLRSYETAYFLMLSIVLALLSGVVFFNDGTGDRTVRISKPSILFMMSTLQPFAALVFFTHSLARAFSVLIADLTKGLYTVHTFLIAHFISQIPILCIGGSLHYSIFYLLGGLRVDGWSYPVIAVCAGIFTQNVAVSLSWLGVAIYHKFSGAIFFSSIITLLSIYFSGFIVRAQVVPRWLSWMSHFSYPNYCFRVLAINEFQNNTYGDGSNLIYGNDVLHSFDISGRIGDPLMALFLMAMTIILFSWILTSTNTISRKNEVLPGFEEEDRAAVNVEQNRIRRLYLAQQDHRLTLDRKVDGANPKSGTSFLIIRNIVLTARLGSFTPFPKSRITKRRPKVLHRISAAFPINELSIIVGPSGSGKTSLLNVIGGRCSPNTYKLTGQIKIDSKRILGKSKRIVSLMDKRRTLHPGLTVEETVYFSARLCGRAMTSIREVISGMGLEASLKCRVGTLDVENKRKTLIATYVVAKPTVLLLDEPCEGLSDAASVNLISTLHYLSRGHTTIIATMHEPSPVVFDEFAFTILQTKDGQLAYAGQARSIREYLKTKFSLQPNESHTHVSEFLDQVLRGKARSKPSNAVTMEDVKNVNNNSRIVSTRELANGWSRHLRVRAGLMSRLYKWHNPTRAKIYFFLLRRMIINLFRSWKTSLFGIFMMLCLVTLNVLVFSNIPSNQLGVVSIMNVILQIQGLFLSGMFHGLYSFKIEREVFYREREDSRAETIPFFAAYNTLSVVVLLIASVLAAMILTYGIGLHSSTSSVSLLVFVLFLLLTFGESVGMFCCVLQISWGLQFAIIFLNLLIVLSCSRVLSGGMNELVEIATFLSPLRFAADVLAEIEVRPLTFTCTSSIFSSCVKNGKEAINLYQFSIKWKRSLLILFLLAVIYRLQVFLGLNYIREHPDDGNAEWRESRDAEIIETKVPRKVEVIADLGRQDSNTTLFYSDDSGSYRL